MDFGNTCLFNKKPEDMRRVGARGGRARARNLRLRKARQEPVTRERNRPHEETMAEATRQHRCLVPLVGGCGVRGTAATVMTEHPAPCQPWLPQRTKAAVAGQMRALQADARRSHVK